MDKKFLEQKIKYLETREQLSKNKHKKFVINIVNLKIKNEVCHAEIIVIFPEEHERVESYCIYYSVEYLKNVYHIG